MSLFKLGFMDKLAEFGFLAKCAEYGADGYTLLKTAGPSLRDRAAAGVPGASAKLRAQEEAKAYRKAHPSPLGSLSEQKAYIKQQGSKALDSLTPEQRSKFWDDAKKFQANALRGRSILGSFLPGVGLAGAAGILGAGEAAASGLEGNDFKESVNNGLLTGAGTFAGGKVISGLGKHVAAPVYRWASKGIKNNVVNPAINRVARFYNKHFPMTDSELSQSIRAPVKGDSSPTFLRRRLYQIVSDMKFPSLGETASERLATLKRIGKDRYAALKAARKPLTEHEKLEAVRSAEKFLREYHGDIIPELSSRSFFKEAPPPLRRFYSLDDLAKSIGVEEGSTSHIFKGGPALAKFDPNQAGFFSGNFRVAGSHTPTRQYFMAADLGGGPFAENVVSRETPHLTWRQQSLNDPAYSAYAREEFAKRLAEIDAGTRSVPNEWAGLPDWRVNYAPNYEVVLKGKEVSGLPWRYFQKMPDGTFLERSSPVNVPTRLGGHPWTTSRDRLWTDVADRLIFQHQGY